MKLAKHLYEVFNKLFEIGYCTDRKKNKEAFVDLVHSIADSSTRVCCKELVFLTDDSVLILDYDTNDELFAVDPYEPCTNKIDEED